MALTHNLLTTPAFYRALVAESPPSSAVAAHDGRAHRIAALVESRRMPADRGDLP